MRSPSIEFKVAPAQMVPVLWEDCAWQAQILEKELTSAIQPARFRWPAARSQCFRAAQDGVRRSASSSAAVRPSRASGRNLNCRQKPARTPISSNSSLRSKRL